MNGLTLEFLEESSVNKAGMKTSESSPHILSDVNKLLKKGIMVNTAHEEGELISHIFLRPKSDGNNWVILSLKNLNQSLEYNQFNMETIYSVAHLMQQNYYVLKIDLTDTYYSVKILDEHTKYLKFFAGSKLFSL